MKNDFVIDHIGDQRWNVAMELLREGEIFVYKSIRFSMDNKEKIIYCDVVSRFESPKNVTKIEAIETIKKAKEIVKEINKKSEVFRSLALQCQIQYALVHDYGTGIVPLFISEGDSVKLATDE